MYVPLSFPLRYLKWWGQQDYLLLASSLLYAFLLGAAQNIKKLLVGWSFLIITSLILILIPVVVFLYLIRPENLQAALLRWARSSASVNNNNNRRRCGASPDP